MKNLRKFISVFMVIQIITNFVLPIVYCEELNNDRRPKVSVIVPVYKTEQYLRECLDSIKNQTLKEIEIICVDDGSPDNCGEILDEYAKKDKRFIIIHQENKGTALAKQSGMDIAKGEYIKYVDSDDYIDLRTLEICYNEAKKDDVDVLVHGAYLFNQDRQWICCKFKYELKTEQQFKIPCRPGALYMHKTDFLKKHGISYRNMANIGEDQCFNMQCMPLAKKVKLLPDILYYYRCYDLSLSRRSSMKRYSIDFCHNIIVAYNQWNSKNHFSNKEAKVYFLKWVVNLLNWSKDHEECKRLCDTFNLLDSSLLTDKDIINKLTKFERNKLCKILKKGFKMSNNIKNKINIKRKNLKRRK